jgi:hypothetical protein
MTVSKRFDPWSASTLRPRHLGTHNNGWTIDGKVHEDYYEWVNYFEATHLLHGRVWGDYEEELEADTKEALDDFMKEFPPENWDYGDI